MLVVMTGPFNPIWNYFHRNESTATCIVCMKELSLGSSLPKNQTVSSIKKHLEKVHRHEYAAFHSMEKQYVLQKSQNVDLKRRAKRKRLKERKEASEGPKERKKPGRKRKLDKHSESDETEHKSSNIEIVLNDPLVLQEHDEPMLDIQNEHIGNIKIEHYKDPTTKPGDVALSRRIDKVVLDLMVVDLLPFNIVEGSAFKRLNLADPYKPRRYSVKSANYYKNTLFPETYESVRKQVNKTLEQAEWISLTTTLWWHHMKTCSIQVISGHFLYENRKHMIVLEVYPMESTQVIATKHLLDLCKKYNIVEKIHLNVVKINEDISTEWFNTLECSDNLLKKVIREALFSGDVIEIVKQKCNSIIDHFITNERAKQNFTECQELCGLSQYSILTSDQNTWTKTYLMWEKLLEQKPALEMYIQQYNDIQVPSEYEWQQIEYLVQLLKIFYQAWLDLNSEAACVSLIIPLLTMLNSKLEQKASDPLDLQYYKKSLKSQLSQYFSFVHQSSALIIATLLDPRFKMRYLNEQQLSSCHAEMTHNLRLSLNLDEDSPNPTYSTLPTNNYNYHNTADLWESHDSTTITENENGSVFVAFDQQLSFYLKEPLIARNANIYQYWNATPYEYLRKLAYKYLTAPPTRLASNDTICEVGSLYAERRLSLKDTDDAKLLFMSFNIKLFNYEH